MKCSRFSCNKFSTWVETEKGAAEEAAATSVVGVDKEAEEAVSKISAAEASNDVILEASSRDFLCGECGK